VRAQPQEERLERAEALSSSCSLQQQLRQQQVEQERELDYVDSMEYSFSKGMSIS
jgi:hypothetical protein